jgi:hypothetical protein
VRQAISSRPQRRGRKAVLCSMVAAVIHVNVASAAAAAKDAIPDDTVTHDSLSLELALMRKTEADELFIKGDVDGARDAYCLAAGETAGQQLQLSNNGNTTLQLLRADIGYRMLLLDDGLGFWGGVQTLRPTKPGPHLQRMKEMLGRFETLGSEISQKVEQAQNADTAAQQAAILADQMASEAKQQLVIADKLDMQQTFDANKADSLSARVDVLHQQRQTLENEVAAATSQAKQASAQLNQIMVDALVQSTGVPPQLADAVQKGNFKDAVMAAATAAVTDSAEFQSAAADVDANLGEIAGYIRQGKELADQAQQRIDEFNTYKDEVKSAGEALRNPTLASLTQLGAQIFPQLPAKVQANWSQAVEAARPAVAAVEMIDVVKDPALASDLRAAAAQYLSQTKDDVAQQLRDAATQYIAQLGASPRIQEVRQQILANAARAASGIEESRVVLDEVARGWAEDMVATLPTPTVIKVVQVLQMTDTGELIATMKVSGLSAFKGMAKLQADGLIVYDRPAGTQVEIFKVALPTLLAIPAAKLPTALQGQDLARMTRTLEGMGPRLRQSVVAALPTGALVEAVRTLAADKPPGFDPGAALPPDAWDNLMQRLPKASRDAAVRQIAVSQAGASFSQQASAKGAKDQKAEAASYGAQSPPSVAHGSPGQDPTQALAMAAVEAAFPGAGVGVAVAAKVLASFNNFNDAVDRAQKAAAQLQQNLGEELQLLDMRNETQLQQALSQKDIEVAKLAQKAALDGVAGYQGMVANLGSTASQLRLGATLRRSLYFYIAEDLRREYDGLDASLDVWSPGGSMASRIVHDPNDIRLALDEDIHLYDWLDRDRESTRGDVEGLVQHWRQLYALASDVCFQQGCSVGDTGALGKYGETEPLGLDRLLSPLDLQRFQVWQKRKDGTSITFSLPFAPGVPQRGLKEPLFDPSLENVRVLDVKIGRFAGNGQYTQLNNIALEHPGAGYIMRAGHLSRVTLLADKESLLKPPTPFTPDELNKILVKDSTGAFLGYPFYTAWQLTFVGSDENYGLKPEDVRLRFGLHYEDPSVISTEQQFLAARNGVDKALGDATQDLPPDQVFVYQAQWTNPVRKVTVSSDGHTKSVMIPGTDRVAVDDAMVALLYTPPATKVGCPAVPTGAPAAPSPSQPSPVPLPDVVRVCRPDAELRRNLFEFYVRRLSPGERPTKARDQAATAFDKLKVGVCKASVSLPRGIT